MLSVSFTNLVITVWLYCDYNIVNLSRERGKKYLVYYTFYLFTNDKTLVSLYVIVLTG